MAHPFYCNFEDTRLFGLGPEDFPAFLEIVNELAPAPLPLFLDEVQEVPEWQRLVRTLLDRGRSVCLTGSNASLLGRELGAKLTGRHLSFEVFPFNYGEHLHSVRQTPGPESLTAYLEEGGFPLYVREKQPAVLQSLLRDVVQRDIVHRHGLRETHHLMNLALFLLGHTGQPISLHSLTKALAIPTVAQTSRYLSYLEDAYLLLALPKFSASFKQRVVAPNKYYAVDNGLRWANAESPTPDRGRRLENAVFLALRQTAGAVSYAAEKDAWECDFVTKTAAIQVTFELTEANRDREIAGLLEAAKFPGPPRTAIMVTHNQRDLIKANGLVISVVPAWEWLQRVGSDGEYPLQTETSQRFLAQEARAAKRQSRRKIKARLSS